MKKFWGIFFVFSIFACIFMVLFLTRNNNIDSIANDNTIVDSEEILNLSVESQIEMVVGQTKQLYFYVNCSQATLLLTQSNAEIMTFDTNFCLLAVLQGQTTCVLKATYKEQIVEKQFIVTVYPKQVDFECIASNFMSGKKADLSYQTYTLTIQANYDFQSSSLLLDDQIIVVSTTFLADDKCVLVFYITLGGEFEIVLDGFCFVGTATEYMQEIDFCFENANFENNTLTLYAITQNQEIAYQDNIFDYAVITLPEQVDLLVYDTGILHFEDDILQALGIGQTSVTLTALDNSGQSACFDVVILPVYAQSCTVFPNTIISVECGQSFEVVCSNFVPVYSTICEVELQSELSFSSNIVTPIENGNVLVLLNGIEICTIDVEVEPAIVDGENPVYHVMFVESSGVTVNMENQTITFDGTGEFAPMRLYLKDESNQNVTANVEIISGNSTASLDGTLLIVVAIDNSTLRITDISGTFYVDFQIIVL